MFTQILNNTIKNYENFKKMIKIINKQPFVIFYLNVNKRNEKYLINL